MDILINNAGINIRGPIQDLSEADWDAVIDTNLKGPWLCARAFGPPMAARGWGRVINMGSILAVIAMPGRTPYASSKAGVVGMTRVLALEWAGSGVTVNAICPGVVRHRDEPAADEAIRRSTRTWCRRFPWAAGVRSMSWRRQLSISRRTRRRT